MTNTLAYCSKGDNFKLDKLWYCYKIWHQNAKKLEFITEMYQQNNNEALALLEQNNLAYCSKGENLKLDNRWYCYKIWHQNASVLFEKTLKLITQMDKQNNNESLLVD